MVDHKRTVTASTIQDLLNYFGKCPMCGHPARASRITAQFDDGRVETQTIASCEGWCGWKGPVDPTPMTGNTIVLTQARNPILPTTAALPANHDL